MRNALTSRCPAWSSGLALLVIGLALLTAGCATGPTAPGGRRGELVELDENTDPELVRTDVDGVIGRVRAAGRHVYVDGEPISRVAPLKNRGHVETGPESGALLEFVRAKAPTCTLVIQAFKRGRLYGDARACLHTALTPVGATSTSAPGAQYQVWLRETEAEVSEAEVMVVRGELTLRPRQSPRAERTLRRNQLAVMTPRRVGEPVELSDAEVQDRSTWRRDFEPTEEPASPDKTRAESEVLRPLIDFAIGLGLDLLREKAARSGAGRDRDVSTPTSEPSPEPSGPVSVPTSEPVPAS